MKRALKWVGIVVALLVVLAGMVWYFAFGNNKPIVEGNVVDGVQTVKDGFVNVFLVDAGPGKVALVDAGNDKSGEALLAALAARNLTASSVAAIFLTHGHGDHTAGCKLFPGADVYAMEADVPLVGNAAKIAHPLHDGEVVTVGDLRVEAFSVPGHTPGSAAYLARGVLFFGDSAGASKTGTLMKAVRLFSKDSAQNVASLTALAGRLAPRQGEIKAMAFGHTGSLVGLDALTAFAAEHP
ncbi:MAG TPA: MBL fold metallo-hydrolase [Polyangiaceae bacterium]|nr:MBL fold metallo-hydrolase [Polyangiaceae bacterium]